MASTANELELAVLLSTPPIFKEFKLRLNALSKLWPVVSGMDLVSFEIVCVYL